MGASRPATLPATKPLGLCVSDANIWRRVAGVSGMAALMLGAYGAHLFRPQNLYYADVWRTASLYHLVHTVTLFGAPFTKRPNIFGGLLTMGIVGFSGACYTAAYMENKSWAFSAPFGSMCWMGAWASLVIGI